jgi:hypothetical protein
MTAPGTSRRLTPMQYLVAIGEQRDAFCPHDSRLGGRLPLNVLKVAVSQIGE